jgi:hypothetical protein
MESIAKPHPGPALARSSLAARFGAFVAERFPFALDRALEAFRSISASDPGRDEAAIDALRAPLAKALEEAFADAATDRLAETTPGVSSAERLDDARTELLDACDGFLRREAIQASLTPAERVEILRGMILTRATDNRLKAFFSGGEVRYKDVQFQGKGFRSLGQEAIYASRSGCAADPRTGLPPARGKATSSRRSSGTSARRSRCDPARSSSAWR